jgi:hypothetical protein
MRPDQLRDFTTVLELCTNRLITARGLAAKTSAVTSTVRVLPEPFGPTNRKFPIGRPSGV